MARLAKAYPDWGPTLDFKTPFQLLVATILAAQASDESVNRVTNDLFARYRAPADYARLSQQELEREIRSLGFFRQKAKAIRESARDLMERFGGEVPRDAEALTSLRGVGRKTAAIVVGAAYGEPAVAVDRHVLRVAGRLGLSKQKDPDRIQEDLMARLPRQDWVKATWTLILHGRRICTPRPQCPRCPVLALCPYPHKTPRLPSGEALPGRGR